MGLGITVYRKLEAVRPLTDLEKEDGEAGDDLVVLRHFNPHYPAHSAGIPEGTAFTAEDEMNFRAGSYGGYSEWRDRLAKLAGHPSAKHAWANGADGKPFFELIHFSDCEGVMNSAICAKLAKDFADCQARVDAMTDCSDGQWFKELYAKWRGAFEMAADSGAVEFH